MDKNALNSYQNPLVTRYGSSAMSAIFSDQFKILTWRRLWLALAESQAQLKLPIKQNQLNQMRKSLENIDFKRAARYEKKFRHDVMAHIHTFADAAPAARPIIHLGATSAFVVDNTDLIQMRKALELIQRRLYHVIDLLSRFALRRRNLATLGYTHFQPAQLTTVGKRATLWCYDFVMDSHDIHYRLDSLRFRGVKGTTGTQASFLNLFDGNAKKVARLEKLVSAKMGFKEVVPVAGQTYSRKVDANIVSTLGGIAQSAHKFCNDMRLLSHLKQIEEPFEKKQIGSSAMPYKQNPMRCERATSLARYVLSLTTSPAMTASEQWFERTLDDSANKRMSIPESFLAVDGILVILADVIDGMVVHPKVINQALAAELPFIATENILMAAVRSGGDRQKLHETIRKHSVAAAKQVKELGKENDLIPRLKADPMFSKIDFANLLNPKDYIGLAPPTGRDIPPGRHQAIQTTIQKIRPRRNRKTKYITI